MTHSGFFIEMDCTIENLVDYFYTNNFIDLTKEFSNIVKESKKLTSKYLKIQYNNDLFVDGVVFEKIDEKYYSSPSIIYDINNQQLFFQSNKHTVGFNKKWGQSVTLTNLDLLSDISKHHVLKRMGKSYGIKGIATRDFEYIEKLKRWYPLKAFRRCWISDIEFAFLGEEFISTPGIMKHKIYPRLKHKEEEIYFYTCNLEELEFPVDKILGPVNPIKKEIPSIIKKGDVIKRFAINDKMIIVEKNTNVCWIVVK